MTPWDGVKSIRGSLPFPTVPAATRHPTGGSAAGAREGGAGEAILARNGERGLLVGTGAPPSLAPMRRRGGFAPHSRGPGARPGNNARGIARTGGDPGPSHPASRVPSGL